MSFWETEEEWEARRLYLEQKHKTLRRSVFNSLRAGVSLERIAELHEESLWAIKRIIMKWEAGNRDQSKTSA